MLATLKILTVLIFKHLDAMAAPKLVLKCSASQNSHHFPSCSSQFQSRNLLFNTLKQSLISCPATQVRKGQQQLSRFFQDCQRNKMQGIFFISF